MVPAIAMAATLPPTRILGRADKSRRRMLACIDVVVGYVTARLVESGFIAIGLLSLLSVVTLRQDPAGAYAADTLHSAFAGALNGLLYMFVGALDALHTQRESA